MVQLSGSGQTRSAGRTPRVSESSDALINDLCKCRHLESRGRTDASSPPPAVATKMSSVVKGENLRRGLLAREAGLESNHSIGPIPSRAESHPHEHPKATVQVTGSKPPVVAV